MDTSDISRFWALIAKGTPDQCWNWTAGRSNSGYGVFNVQRQPINSHRLAAILSFGPPTNGQYVLHSCDNRLCCNPSHLRYGTQRENMKDSIERGSYSPPPPSKLGKLQTIFGEDIWNAALTEHKVREIWRLHLSGKNTAEIALATESPRDAVVDACRGRTWRHLKGAPSIKILSKGGVRRAKLTPENIETAKRLIKEGLSNKAIGAILGTSPTPISWLRNYGTTWRPKP